MSTQRPSINVILFVTILSWVRYCVENLKSKTISPDFVVTIQRISGMLRILQIIANCIMVVNSRSKHRSHHI